MLNRLVFRLPLRQAEGFLKSILILMDLYLPCPDHTTISRRNRTARIRRNTRGLPDGPVCFIDDSTGLKICGQGEWHAKKHGKRLRKRWKKLHLGVYVFDSCNKAALCHLFCLDLQFPIIHDGRIEHKYSNLAHFSYLTSSF
ncbi:MAG: hypothetical protein GTN76_15620 [Candidatus Aenigmarchaeota archaeon]|nr:hypothetical protein [Candidatus Aenigmarchaeota archaeon]